MAVLKGLALAVLWEAAARMAYEHFSMAANHSTPSQVAAANPDWWSGLTRNSHFSLCFSPEAAKQEKKIAFSLRHLMVITNIKFVRKIGGHRARVVIRNCFCLSWSSFIHRCRIVVKKQRCNAEASLIAVGIIETP